MDFSFTPEQDAIRDAIAKICTRFPDDYWLKKDKEGGFPTELHQALAKDGWLGVAMPCTAEAPASPAPLPCT
jgi:acyl-CoA dehydrogenase